MCHKCNRELIALLVDRLAPRPGPHAVPEEQDVLRDLAFLLTHSVTGEAGDGQGNDNTDADVEAIAGRLALRSTAQLRRLGMATHYWSGALEYAGSRIKAAIAALAKKGDAEARALVVGMRLHELATAPGQDLQKDLKTLGSVDHKVAAHHLN